MRGTRMPISCENLLQNEAAHQAPWFLPARETQADGSSDGAWVVTSDSCGTPRCWRQASVCLRWMVGKFLLGPLTQGTAMTP